jgi:hypothetical protein
MPSCHRVSTVLFDFYRGPEELKSQVPEANSALGLQRSSQDLGSQTRNRKQRENKAYPAGRRVGIPTIVLPFAVDSAVGRV